MSDPTPTYSRVRLTFLPYNHDEVQTLLKKVTVEFGRANQGRWYYQSPQDLQDTEHNAWVLDFVFRDPHDALIFGLKYQKG